MSDYVHFDQIKEQLPIEQAIPILGLKMRQQNGQYRGPCPHCQQGGDRTLAITPAKAAYFCFSDGHGGDVIALAAHVQGTTQREAARFLADHLTLPDRSPQPRQEAGLKPLDYLEHDHEAVEIVGFDAETAKALGIGYAKKGVLRGFVAIPIRTETGKLVGYVGANDLKMPPKWNL